MDKQQLLNELKDKLASGELSQSELNSVVKATGGPVAEPEQLSKLGEHFTLQEIIFYIGGAVVFIGLAFLISQNWDAFNAVTRILITLGSAVAAYVMAFLFYNRPDTKKVAQPFFLLSALLLPVGIGVSLYESNWNLSGDMAAVLISGLSLIVFAVTLAHFKNNLHLLFVTIFGTWLFFAATGMVAEDSAYYVDQDFFLYRMLVVGVSYLLLGYYFKPSNFGLMSGPYFFFGSFAFLLAAIILGGWTPDQNVFWELVYPILSLGLVFASTKLKSRAMLLWGTVFFMAYLIKISSEYFADSLGWPFALIISGLSMIAVGYYAFRIKKEYIG
jgi:hypothetical protein